MWYLYARAVAALLYAVCWVLVRMLACIFNIRIGKPGLGLQKDGLFSNDEMGRMIRWWLMLLAIALGLLLLTALCGPHHH